ncbi:MAG: DinB family protein [Chitinophagales bacterium]
MILKENNKTGIKMEGIALPEFWMRGPIEQVPPLLQPVAHCLLQARQEIQESMNGFPESLLWERPLGLASPGFHLQHIIGFLDRLFTYARNESLNSIQLKWLAGEGKGKEGLGLPKLLAALDARVEASIAQLIQSNPHMLLDRRGVGRKQLPSNVLGLYFHAAEHAMRHNGQLMVTVSILKARDKNA